MHSLEGAAITRRSLLLAFLAAPPVTGVKESPARTPFCRDLASDVAAWDAARLSDRWVDWCATRPTHSLPPRAARSAE